MNIVLFFIFFKIKNPTTLHENDRAGKPLGEYLNSRAK